MTTLAQIGRGTRAEAIRAGGRRSFLLWAGIPAGIVLPLLLTFGYAFLGEYIAGLDSDDIGVTATETTNSINWVLVFTAVVGACCAAYAQAIAMRGVGRDFDRYLYPRAWTSAFSRWLFYGLLNAVVTTILSAAVMLLLPVLFPLTCGQVDLFSVDGMRFLITVPIYAFFACGFAIGLAALIGHPAGTIAVLLFWVFVVEDATVFIPTGNVTAYMPFLNGVWGTGQYLVIDPPWGKDGALIWFAAIASVVFAMGALALAARRRAPHKLQA